MNKLNHSRQLPLAEKYIAQIHREQVRGNEAILAELCFARTAGHRAGANARIQRAIATSKPIAADIVIHVATRGENPGPGAWGATIITKDGLTRESEWYPHMPQPLLELEAMIAVLHVIQDQAGTVAIHTTARWIAEYLNDGTAEKWQANDWRKSCGDPVQHAESWAELLRLWRERKPAIAWLKKDATAEMARAHQLAARAFRAKKAV